MRGPFSPSLEIDHLVLVARDVEATLRFYADMLGAEIRDLSDWRTGRVDYPVLHFGTWKINVHAFDRDLQPVAAAPTPGSADICLRIDCSTDDIVVWLHALGIPVESGPISEEGALGKGTSLYFRDPDGNLLEVICYGDGDGEAGPVD